MTCSAGRAQNWGGGVDDDDLHYGFTFQYVLSEFKILKKATWRNPVPELDGSFSSNDSLNLIYSKPSAGFGIGFVGNKRLTSHTDLRFTPTLVFSDRILVYGYSGRDAIEKKIQSTLVDLPVGLKLKSDRRGNFRAYVIGGARYSIDISSKKKTNNDLVTDPAEKFVNNKKAFLSYEAGLGLDLYFEYFKMSPEIKLSYSMNDVLKHETNRYVTPLDKLMLRHLTFSLFFE
ncbi:PorT family protein [Pedobacter psychroterrae]|uniref:PorT family protein n=2 Tax=Pedobacter psychroterrae TaxID=2530453 RepID=A0A4R0NS87_9SPHI|nr:PorT family protein [Pedobacter psychroterrae]